METAWNNSIKRQGFFPPLKNNITADVVIVGGGLSGVLTAYELSRTGASVVLLEKEHIGSGATAYTTAFLTQVVDTGLAELVSMYGKKDAAHIWHSHKNAIDYLESIVKREDIACDFMRCSLFLYAATSGQTKAVTEEAHVARLLGFRNVGVVGEAGVLPFIHHGYAEVKNQAKFHPLKFLHELAQKLPQYGTRVFEQTEAVGIVGSSPVTLSTGKGFSVKAKDVIIATYNPFNQPKQVFAKKGMYKSFVIEARIPQGTLPEALFQDMYNPYNYFRIDKLDNADRLILGGADVRSELPVSEEKSFIALEDYLKTSLELKNVELIRKWAGLILEPSDGIALIGEYKPHYYLAAAFSGNGMTYAGIAATVLTDLVHGQENAWARLYSPLRPRKPSRYFTKGLDYIKEFFGGAVRNTLLYGGR